MYCKDTGQTCSQEPVALKNLESIPVWFEQQCTLNAFSPKRNPWQDLVQRNIGQFKPGEVVKAAIPSWFLGDFFLTIEVPEWLQIVGDPQFGPIISGTVPDMPLGIVIGRSSARNGYGTIQDQFELEVKK